MMRLVRRLTQAVRMQIRSGMRASISTVRQVRTISVQDTTALLSADSRSRMRGGTVIPVIHCFHRMDMKRKNTPPAKEEKWTAEKTYAFLGQIWDDYQKKHEEAKNKTKIKVHLLNLRRAVLLRLFFYSYSLFYVDFAVEFANVCSCFGSP